MKGKDVTALIRGCGYKVERYNWDTTLRNHGGSPIALRIHDDEYAIHDGEYWFGKMRDFGTPEITLFYETSAHPSVILTQLPRVLNLREVLDRNEISYKEIPCREEAQELMEDGIFRFLAEEMNRLTRKSTPQKSR